MVRSRMIAVLVLAAPVLAGCAGTTPEVAASPVPPPASDPIHTEADVAFMENMIGHHAQAVRIARWAPTHGASPAVLRLAERIVVGQQDEIAMMQRWLRDHAEPVPDPYSDAAAAAAMAHAGHMPGMLSAADLARLDAARGTAFDRLFLTLMIRHHQGAVTMVNELFASQGAGEDDTVFRLASDVQADQTVEIRRMQSMLAALPTLPD